MHHASSITYHRIKYHVSSHHASRITHHSSRITLCVSAVETLFPLAAFNPFGAETPPARSVPVRFFFSFLPQCPGALQRHSTFRPHRNSDRTIRTEASRSGPQASTARSESPSIVPFGAPVRLHAHSLCKTPSRAAAGPRDCCQEESA